MLKEYLFYMICSISIISLLLFIYIQDNYELRLVASYVSM